MSDTPATGKAALSKLTGAFDTVGTGDKPIIDVTAAVGEAAILSA